MYAVAPYINKIEVALLGALLFIFWGWSVYCVLNSGSPKPSTNPVASAGVSNS